MRWVSKKYGNLGDIELLEDWQIVGAWDACYQWLLKQNDTITTE